MQKGVWDRKMMIMVAAVCVVVILASLLLSNREVKAPQVGDQKTTELQTQSTSDEVESIDKDLKDTNLNDLDSDVPAIDNELQY